MAALRARVGTDAQARISTRAGREAAGVAGALACLVALSACSPRPHREQSWKKREADQQSTPVALLVADAGTADASTRQPADALAAAEPVFKLVASEKKQSDVYPCSECHDADMETDPKPRKFDDDHADIALNHGGGRVWCLDCHDADKRDMLTRVGGTPVPFERADRVCAKCHFRQQRDFMHGAHGKRVGNWRGERVLWPCVRCHDPHAPVLAQRAPMSGPGVPGATGRGQRREP